MSLTVFAASASTTFPCNGMTVNCSLNADWNTLSKDSAYAKTYVKNGSGNYPLGAYCNAYGKNGLLGGTNITAYDTAQTSTINYNATEFRSSHNMQDSSRVPLASRQLTLK